MKNYQIYQFTSYYFCFFLFATNEASAQNPLLRDLIKEDQDYRSGKKIDRTDEERVKLVLEQTAQGAVKTAEDKFIAAIVLQHTGLTICEKRLVSFSPDNYLLAHYLLISALDSGYEKARYYVAASIDRYLSFTEGYQKYGTNRVINQETGKEELVPIDRKTPDSERAKYGVPPLSELLKKYPEQAQKKTPKN
jgi:hypothetical protein